MQRRSFLTRAALGAGALSLSRPWSPQSAWAALPNTQPGTPPGTPLGTLPGLDAAPSAGDPALKVLTDAALDAARRAGATYADVRLTKTRTLGIGATNGGADTPSGSETISAGVRVLVDNAWGFLSGSLWTVDDLARFAAAAVAQARANHWETTQPVTLSETPPVVNGTWTTPIVRDPFTVPLDEQLGVLLAAHGTVMNKPGFVRASSRISWSRQEKTFASSEGSFLTQTLYRFNGGQCGVTGSGSGIPNTVDASGTQAAGGGYELLLEAKLEEQFPRMLDEANKKRVPAVEVEVGRYDIVFGGNAMAALVEQTIGQALQLDRALGFEANAAGTSYLAPPEKMLGQMVLAPSFVNVTANRSLPRGCATVKWDDEGVAPEDYALVKEGVVTDYQTTRAQADWLSSWYAHQHRPVRSHGDAYVPDAFFQPMQHVPNLALEPGAGNATLDDLIAPVDKGLLVLDMFGLFDQELATAMLAGSAVEIVKGKLGRPVSNVGIQIRSTELWKNVAAIGGAGSVVTTAQHVMNKGEPAQQSMHTVTAVPARILQQNVINFGLRV